MARLRGSGSRNCCAHGVADTAYRDFVDVVGALGNFVARDRGVRAVVVEAPEDMTHVGCRRHRRRRLSVLGAPSGCSEKMGQYTLFPQRSANEDSPLD